MPAYYTDRQFTQEFQGQFENGRWSGVAGVYFLDSRAAGVFDTIAGNLGVSIAAAGSVETTSWSVFGDFSYAVSDRLDVSVGGRWTSDDKTGDVYRAFYLGATRSPLTGGTPRAPLAIRTEAGTDTTLVVNGPDGQWYCDDDSGGGTNAQVYFAKPSSGTYDIWVGTYGGGTQPATLLITEVP